MSLTALFVTVILAYALGCIVGRGIKRWERHREQLRAARAERMGPWGGDIR